MTLGPDIRTELYAEDGEQAVIYLLTIEHPDIAPIRITDDNVDHVSQGEVFESTPMEVSLPDELDDEDRAIRIRIDNVASDVLEKLENLPGPPEVTLELALSDDLDAIRGGPFTLELDDVGFNAVDISGELVFDDLVNDTYPKVTFTPQTAPGLFR